MRKVTGGCLCGTVTFEVVDQFEHFHFCHCAQCQKTTGTAHAANLFTKPANITWLSGEDAAQRYDLPGRRISNAFCQHCGSRLPYLSLSGEVLVVPAGALDASATLAPRANIFWPERATWLEEGIAAPRYATYME